MKTNVKLIEILRKNWADKWRKFLKKVYISSRIEIDYKEC